MDSHDQTDSYRDEHSSDDVHTSTTTVTREETERTYVAPPPEDNRGAPTLLLLGVNLLLLGAAVWWAWNQYEKSGGAPGEGHAATTHVGTSGLQEKRVRGHANVSDTPDAVGLSQSRGRGNFEMRTVAGHGTVVSGGGSLSDYSPAERDNIAGAERLIDNLGVELEVVRAIRGGYPGSNVDFGANRGIEAVVAILRETKRMPEWLRLADTDGDGRDEIVDAWGNPLLYFSSDDYGNKQGAAGVADVATPRSALTGRFHAPERFQMWSLGPDGANDAGGGDDVCSWIIRE